jgi:nitrogen fixation/metabolism regulation signal transduction histidine kinase
VVAILVTAIIPLATAMGLAAYTIRSVSDIAFNPEFDVHLDRALGVYADLVKALKAGMRYEAEALGARADVKSAVADAAKGGKPEREALTATLAGLLPERPHILEVAVGTAEGEKLGEARRATPLDTRRERSFAVRRSLGEDEEGPQLTVVFAADRSRLDEMEDAQSFVQAHREFSNQHRGEWIDQPYTGAFAALLGATVLLAMVSGIRVMRPVARRINRMAAATRPVAEGDLSVRVEADGKDEIADLARAFNHMLETLERSRARIEFLSRIGEWQNMARRLAHEIKNPLTPIQLAVEECHRRYPGDDVKYQQLLRTTVDIVVEEVGALRRLVGEFAEFARLPRAHVEAGDLAAYLREQRERLERWEIGDGSPGVIPPVELRFEIDDAEMPVAFDRELLYRALFNLVANAAQAIEGATPRPEEPRGLVRLSARRAGEHVVVDIEDNGPGIDPSLGAKVFDPYRTTKKDGTGLGLTIVKKVVMEHGGTIDVDDSPLGGARFRMRLPLAGTSDAEAAMAPTEATLGAI